MDHENTAPYIGNRSDALELLDKLIGMVNRGHSKKFLILWYALKVLKGSIERGIV
ncbi:hypothetical protein FACS1894130_10570 [Spirochaetia bacterium]|nr:hypothetical protein FACS1894130_10570 [Spirochaetia bacterium]